jgi:TolB protein
MKKILVIILSSLAYISAAQDEPAGSFQFSADIGNPKKSGSALYDKINQSFTLKGGGYNIWFDRDEFYFLFSKIEGDFILTANFEFIGKGSNAHRKTGWMVRESRDEKSAHIWSYGTPVEIRRRSSNEGPAGRNIRKGICL